MLRAKVVRHRIKTRLKWKFQPCFGLWHWSLPGSGLELRSACQSHEFTWLKWQLFCSWKCLRTMHTAALFWMGCSQRDGVQNLKGHRKWPGGVFYPLHLTFPHPPAAIQLNSLLIWSFESQEKWIVHLSSHILSSKVPLLEGCYARKRKIMANVMCKECKEGPLYYLSSPQGLAFTGMRANYEGFVKKVPEW